MLIFRVSADEDDTEKKSQTRASAVTSDPLIYFVLPFHYIV